MESSTELSPLADLNEMDDLGNLLEFGNIDLDTFTDSTNYNDHMQQQQGTHPNTPFHDLGNTPPIPGTSAHDFGGHEQFTFTPSIDQQQFMAQHKHHAPTSNPYTTESMYQPSVQQAFYPQAYQFQAQQGFAPTHQIPPTPNSYEMHGETARFLQQPQHMAAQQQAILEQRYSLRKDDAIAFTPMVSPAGTPQFNIIPEYTTPGAYFSPLTSPMLMAQNQQHFQGYHTNPSTAPSSSNLSPIDPSLDMDMLDGMNLPESAGARPRRSRRKIATPKTSAANGKVRQSSLQKRKSMPTSVNASYNDPALSHTLSGGQQLPLQQDSSEADSVSPEALSENVMGPPPRPGSTATHSPALVGQQQQSMPGPAATPKSLLTTRGFTHSISSPSITKTPASQSWPRLDDLSLPEAAASRRGRKPSLSQINTQIITSDDSTSQPSARKTPKLGPLSTPASARPGSVAQSPIVAEPPVPASTPSAMLGDRKDSKNGRGSKKRGSMTSSSSKVLSPALVPKISPSIKPLLPEGTTLNTATHALLLASKSNYQNLLEGNHLPGVTYPEHLQTGLTSKRTSHKVAEQGRRTRINDALKEMQTLIPKSSGEAGDINGDAGGNEYEKAAEVMSKEDVSKSNICKAATVELANKYIKRMQKDHAAQSADMERLRLENEALRKRLGTESASSSDDRSRTADSASPGSQ